MILGSPTWISNHSGSNVTEIAITSGIDSTYSTYLLVMTDLAVHGVPHCPSWQTDHAGTTYNNPHCTTNIEFRYNDDASGASFSQQGGILYGNNTIPVEMGRRLSTGAGSAMNCIFYIFDPSTATTETQYMWHVSQYTDALDGTVGLWNNGKENGAGTISKIRFVTNGGSNISGTINMYGVS